MKKRKELTKCFENFENFYKNNNLTNDEQKNIAMAINYIYTSIDITTTEIKEKIDIMKAFLKGKRILETRGQDQVWERTLNPSWDWKNHSYCIAHIQYLLYKYAYRNKSSSEWKETKYFYETGISAQNIMNKEKISIYNKIIRLDYTKIELLEKDR